MAEYPPFYAPVLGDLARVEENLHNIWAGQFSGLSPLLAHTLEAPGKRVRPALTLLASRLHPGSQETPVLAATAVELLHIATLVHDDTVDKAPLRRGRPTLSHLWGPQAAILVGDYLFALSAVFICDTRNLRVVRRFAQTIQELSAGELMEHFTAYDWRQGRERYWERVYHKTASLFATAAEVGAVVSGAPEEEVTALREYGRSLGMAFQVVDDLLDFEGDPEEVGKPVGNDLAQGTLTLPALLLLERFPQDNPIPKAFQGEDQEANLRKALQMVKASGILGEASQVAAELCRQATGALAPLPEGEVKASLHALASFVLERRK